MGAFSSHPESRVVQTHYGKVIGRRLFTQGEKNVDAFQGIPYAKPPVGDRRFRKPEPPEPWDGVFEAKSFGNRAIQRDMLFFDGWRKGQTSEDCLLLNVFAPCWEPPSGGFPVMVYIHGGGFSMDSAETYGDVGICERLCMKDVIFVTIQYRLGYLGFWSTEDSSCPGNFGLWDQTEALKWIQLNIAAFGGNKENVTILGQSAGGASVDFLSLSPHSNHLFHKVIPMAGTASAPWALSPSMKLQCEKKALRLGCDWKGNEDLMSQLRDLPSSAFAISLIGADTEKEADLECTPVIDGDFLPSSVEEMRKAAPAKPRMTGVARMEGLLFLVPIKSSARKLKKLMYRALPKDLPNRDSVHVSEAPFMRYRIRPHKVKYATVNEALMIRLSKHRLQIRCTVPDGTISIISKILCYDRAIKAVSICHTSDVLSKYVDLDSKPDTDTVFRAMNEIYSDFSMNTPHLKQIQQTIEAHPESPVYSYVFSHLNPKAWGPLRWYLSFLEASHCHELPYIFNKGIIFGFSFTEEDNKMAELFSTAFTNFAKYGDPNGAPGSSDLPVRWEPATEEHPERHYNFDSHPELADVYFKGRPAELLHYQKLSDANTAKL